MKTEQVTIIGAGPGGIAAAIQLKRWGLEPLLLERDHIGGLLVNANLVENYPGFPGGISGIGLVRFIEEQMKRTGVTVDFEKVLKLDHDQNFIVKTSKRDLVSQVVIVASGTKPRLMDSVQIAENVADRILYEVYPIIDVEEKRIAIVGAGDAAFDYALNLARKNSVTILNRSEKRKCLPLLWERTQRSSRIDYHENSAIASLGRSDDAVVLACKNPQGDWELVADYVIFAIGREPQLGFITERFKEKSAELEKGGWLYYVGDVKNDIYRQTSIAVGDAVRAAMQICEKFRGAD